MKSQMIRVLALFAALILILISRPRYVVAQERIKSLPHPFAIPQHAPAHTSGQSQSRAAIKRASSTSNSVSPWTPLTHQSPSGPNGIQIMVPATDGSILLQAYDWQSRMKLTPDA
jgi:hypothetical protein